MNGITTEQVPDNTAHHAVTIADRRSWRRIAVVLRTDGLVILGGFDERQDVLEFTTDNLRIFKHPDSAADGVTYLAGPGAIVNHPGRADSAPVNWIRTPRRTGEDDG